MKISLLVAHHKNGPFISTDYIKPIHVGASISEPIGFMGDNIGINISEKNKNYCELTAQYWAWKTQLQNYDYFGFMHYRRYFMFKSPNQYKKNIIDEFDNTTINDFGLEDSSVLKGISNYEIIMPPKWYSHPANMRGKKMSVYDFYAREHIKSDLDTAINVIKELYPEYNDALEETMSKSKAYFLNMYIMNRNYFNEYMEWIFTILFEVEKRITISNDPYQARVFGFLSERLINVFINHVVKRDNPRIKELNVAFCRFEPSLREKNKVGSVRKIFRKLSLLKGYIKWIRP
jgi:hypothetical protein